MKKIQPVIGLEVHVQLNTRSKMFCSCSRDYFNSLPNTKVCPVCLGMPGVLPVINKKAVKLTILTGLAFDCSISTVSSFARKNYHYPDLVKGYQISQFEEPLCIGGKISFMLNNEMNEVSLERIHLEEDTARLIHNNTEVDNSSLMDINRSGVPLMEVVSDPDMHSADQAIGYLKKLRQTLRYINVSDADMEKGSFRCDANISVRYEGDKALGKKVEVKNMNSFRSIHRAIETEIERQSKMLHAGEDIAQETRGFVDAKGITVSQRSKEQAHDYRYFPEPDLPPLFNSETTISDLKMSLQELPNIKSKRFQDQYGLLSEESELLVSTKLGASNFEESVKEYQKLLKKDTKIELAKTVANWYMGDIAQQLNQINPDAELQDTQVSPKQISELLQLIHEKYITVSSAKVVLEKMFNNEGAPKDIVEQESLGQLNNSDEIIKIILNVIQNNEKAIRDYSAGKTSALGYLVGQVMKETRGRIDANEASQMLIKKISEKN